MEQFLNLLISVLKGEEILIDEELLKGKYQESMSFKKGKIHHFNKINPYFKCFLI